MTIERTKVLKKLMIFESLEYKLEYFIPMYLLREIRNEAKGPKISKLILL